MYRDTSLALCFPSVQKLIIQSAILYRVSTFLPENSPMITHAGGGRFEVVFDVAARPQTLFKTDLWPNFGIRLVSKALI